jgi:hypothetical protein
LLSAAASARSAPVRLSTVAGTRACLSGLPDAIVGLPPAIPPTKPAIFVYSYPSSHFSPATMRGRLSVWSGQERGGAYGEATLSFFKTVRRAKVDFGSNGGSLIGNVVVTWDRPALAGVGWRKLVQACIRYGPPVGGGIPKQAVPPASLATFAGYWGGHTRGLSITSGGHGNERTNSGCCNREYRMSFRILSVTGSLTRAAATYRVTYFKRYDATIPNHRLGQVGKLLLRNGIVTNTLSRVYFCSDPAWGATGACGA